MSSVSPACRKRLLNGAVSRNNRIKRLAPCRCLDGHVNESYEMSITEISSNVTLINQSHSTIFQLYLWRHMHVHVVVQSALEKKVDIRSGSQHNRQFVGFFKVPTIQHWHRIILSVIPRLYPSMAQWDSNSQLKDNPNAVSLCLDNRQILNRLLRHALAHGQITGGTMGI